VCVSATPAESYLVGHVVVRPNGGHGAGARHPWPLPRPMASGPRRGALGAEAHGLGATS